MSQAVPFLCHLAMKRIQEHKPMLVVRRKTVNIKQMFVNIDATSNKKQQWHHEDKNKYMVPQTI